MSWSERIPPAGGARKRQSPVHCAQMNDEASNLVKSAEEHLQERRFSDAAKCFEQAAGAEGDRTEAAQLWRKAAEAYEETRSMENAGRCYRGAAELMDNEEKTECLMTYWRLLIMEIAGCQWECCFEWRGDMDGEHDDDHEYNQNQIMEYREEAERVLREVLNIDGINRRKIIREAKKEHRRRKKDGWGAGVCATVIANATADRSESGP